MLILVRIELSRALTAMLSAHMPHPVMFGHALTRFGAFVGGTCAVRYLLRLPPDPTDTLEIFLSYASFDAMRHYIQHEHGARHEALSPGSAHDGLVCVAEYDTDLGPVTLLQSTGLAIFPMCRASNSALLAYVRPGHFGLGWPRLTLNLHALAGDLDGRSPLAADAVRTVGIDTKLWPWMWHGAADQACTRTSFCCPAQARSTEDAGFLACRMNPLVDTVLGFRIEFRLCRRACHGGCRRIGVRLHDLSTMAMEY